MSVQQYSGDLNPFSQLASMVKTGDGSGKSALGHAMIMQQIHHAGVMEQLERGHELGQSAADAEHRRSLQRQEIGHEQAKELEGIRAKHAAEQTTLQHEGAVKAARVQAGIAETAASKSHARNLELAAAIHRASAPGTDITFKSGDVSAKYTKKVPTKKAVVQSVATSAPVEQPKSSPAPSAGSSGWVQPTGKFKRANKKLNIVSKTPAAAPKAQGPSVGRDPKTGKIVSLKKK